MVIQRWQSVFMFVAALLMVAVNFMSWGVFDGGVSITPVDIPAMLTINIVTAILLVVAIFMFRNMSLQKTLVRISAVFVLVSALVGGLVIYNNEGIALNWGGGILAMVAALLFTVMAMVRISADERLLKSADRIR